MAIDIELRRLVNQEAHARLDGLLGMIAAADARAVGILAASISLAGVAGAASLTLLQIKGLSELLLAHMALWGLAAPSLAAAAMATWALRSRDMVLPGFSPQAFEHDWAKPEEDVIVSMLKISQDSIATNTRAYRHLNARNQVAVDCLSVAPVGAAIGAVCTFGPAYYWPIGLVTVAIVGAYSYLAAKSLKP